MWPNLNEINGGNINCVFPLIHVSGPLILRGPPREIFDQMATYLCTPWL